MGIRDVALGSSISEVNREGTIFAI
jgi:hypothetical protein